MVFRKFKELSVTSRDSARFNSHSCTVASSKVPAIIVYDLATKVIDTEIFPQHNIAGLISGIAFIVFVQSGEAFTVAGNKHTHTNTLIDNLGKALLAYYKPSNLMKTVLSLLLVINSTLTHTNLQ